MDIAPPKLTQAAPALKRALDVLTPLQNSVTGRLILSHIEQRLQEYTAQQLISRHLLTDTIGQLLDSLANTCRDEQTRAALRIARLGLNTNLSNGELKLLQQEIRLAIAALQHSPAPSGSNNAALDGLVEQITQSHSNSPDAEYQTLSRTEATLGPQHAAVEQMVNEVNDPTPIYDVDSNELAPGYQHYLDTTRSSMGYIQAQLGEQITNTLRLNDELAAMLHSSVNTLCLTDWHDSTSEIRNEYVDQCNDLIKRHQDLSTHFDNIRSKLNDISHGNERLAVELADVYKLSLTDELTDLPNRRALLQRLDDEISRASRYATPLTFAIIDIDYFKSINDNHGHDVGDQVLAYFSKHVLSIFRHHDTVARYGGEEFAALLPNTDIEGALCALDKVKMRAAQGICPGINRTTPTFSAGLALYQPGESHEELIKRADIALYEAKEKGRNRVEVHPLRHNPDQDETQSTTLDIKHKQA